MSKRNKKPHDIARETAAVLSTLQNAALTYLRAALAGLQDGPCTCIECVGPDASYAATAAALAATNPHKLAADAIALATACIDDATAQLYAEAEALRNAPPVAPSAPWPTLQ